MTTIANIPVDSQAGWAPPAAGLAICTIAVSYFIIVTLWSNYFFEVERAFRYWKTGHLVIPSKRVSRKFSKNHWGFATGEIIRSTECLTSKQWKKLKALAMECMEGLIGVPEEVMCVRAKVSTGRAYCVEDDSESESQSESQSESGSVEY